MSKRKSSPLTTLGGLFVAVMFIAGLINGDNETKEVESPNANVNIQQEKILGNDVEEIIEELPKCNDKKDTEISRSCSDCNKTTIVYWNSDCSTYGKDIEDSNCSSLCPPPEPIYVPPPVVQPSTPSYSCNCSKTCTQMNSCDEAYFQLNSCGCYKRDGDHDGIPCEEIC